MSKAVPEQGGFDEKLDEILKSHACTQVFFDEYSEKDYPIMFQKILGWHKKQVEAELEALLEEIKHEGLRTISQVITARVDKLKESTNE